MTFQKFFVFGFSLMLFTCNVCRALPKTIEGPFATPESVAYDSRSDLYLVSNINGSPTAKDNNGFISRVSPDGKILDAQWIVGGKNGIELNAPKGIALFRDELIVTDIDVVRKFNARNGTLLSTIAIPGAKFLNDVAVDPNSGDLFVSDSGFNSDFTMSGAQALYKIGNKGQVAKIAKSSEFGALNGVAIDPQGGAKVVTFDDAGQILPFSSDSMGKSGGKFPEGQLDGLIILKDGSEIVSSWKGSSLYLRTPEGAVSVLASELSAPADIGFDPKRSLVVVPLFNANKLVLIPIPG